MTAPIVILQTQNNQQAKLALGNAVGADDLLIVAASTGASIGTVRDTIGPQYNLAASSIDPGFGTNQVVVWWGIAPRSGANTVFVPNAILGAFAGLQVWEVAGANALHAAQGGGNVSSATWNGGLALPRMAPVELILYICSANSELVSNPTTGTWTQTAINTDLASIASDVAKVKALYTTPNCGA